VGHGVPLFNQLEGVVRLLCASSDELNVKKLKRLF
jgi:hypothetical protein